MSVVDESGSKGVGLLLLGLGLGLLLGGVIGYLYASVGNQRAVTTALADSQAVIERTAAPTATKAPTPTQTPAPARVDMAELLDDDPWEGDKNAKVVIVEFSDFQCPFCERFAAQTLPQLKTNYIDTGKAVLIYRDFPLSSIHPDAEKAAEAAECADDQGKFWEYHDKLFENRLTWIGVGAPEFKEYASELGLDAASFNDCLDSGKYTDEVAADLSAGQGVGVTGTPTFFINGVRLVGAQPFSNFQKVIDEELAKTG